MPPYTVTVIMPAYNHERFVAAAVESVLNQSHDDLQLIVIDDGSTDRTGEIVQSFRDPRIRYIHQTNQDAFNALNNGLRMVETPLVAILNSDDVYAPRRLERLSEVHRQAGHQCVFTDVEPITDQGDPIHDPEFFWHRWHQSNRRFYFDCADLYTAFLHANIMVTTSNLFMTREAVRRVGEFCSLRYLHDYDYIFRVMLAFPGQVGYLADEVLLQYRVHGSNTLSEAAVIGREQDREVIRRYLLARFGDDDKKLINTAVDRLVALEHELIEVRAQRPRPQADTAASRPHRRTPGLRGRIARLLR